MTREEASRLVAAHFAQHEVKAPGLDDEGHATALIAGEQLSFEHLEDTGVLRCSALIYRWREWPRPGLLEALRKEARRSEETTRGGVLDYVPERRTLSLTRQFTRPLTPPQLEHALAPLRQACAEWRSERFARVAEQVLHPR